MSAQTLADYSQKLIYNDGFRVRYVSGMPAAAIESALAKRREWEALAPPNARIIVLTQLPGYAEPVAVKFFPTVQAQHLRSFSKRGRFRQFASRYAVREMKNSRLLNSVGVRTPAILAYGERWQYLQRHEGMVIMEYITAPTLQARLEEGDLDWVDSAVDAMARLHNAGLVHGDMYPRNCFAVAGETLMFDLETVDRINPVRQMRDITRLLVPLWVYANNEQAMHAAFDRYRSAVSVAPSLAEWQQAAVRKKNNWPSGDHIAEHALVINELS